VKVKVIYVVHGTVRTDKIKTSGRANVKIHRQGKRKAGYVKVKGATYLYADIQYVVIKSN